jgi:hypothetical protein
MKVETKSKKKNREFAGILSDCAKNYPHPVLTMRLIAQLNEGLVPSPNKISLSYGRREILGFNICHDPDDKWSKKYYSGTIHPMPLKLREPQPVFRPDL